MRTCLFVLLAAAACAANAEIILNIPSVIVPPSSAPTDLSLDVTFTLTAPDVSQQMIGYDLYPIVTGGNGLSITGVGTGSDRPPNPVFDTDPFYNASLCWFTDITAPGSPGTIYDGSALLRIKAQLQGGATGTYHIDPYVNKWARPGDATDFFSDVSWLGVLIRIPVVYQGGTVSVALPGDANLDGTVNITDLSRVLTNYDKTGMGWSDGDFNNDGIANISDLSNVLTNYDKSLDASAGIKPVPEPATLVLLSIAAIGIVGYAWRRKRPVTG
jgi:hypothetical protein